jgi:DNA-directed RNA polymerase subunit RPC12/RpoP
MVMAKQKKQTPAELRAEADRIERETRKAERLADADTIPTCPECGSRVFKIDSWTVVGQSISFEQDEKDGDWCDDYQSGDHTDENANAECAECGADVEDVLERHGWTFYDAPQPTTNVPATTPLDAIDIKHLRSAAERLRQGGIDAAAAADMGRMIDLLLDHRAEGVTK